MIEIRKDGWLSVLIDLGPPVKVALWQHAPRHLEGGIHDATLAQALTWENTLRRCGLAWFVKVLRRLEAGEEIGESELIALRDARPPWSAPKSWADSKTSIWFRRS